MSYGQLEARLIGGPCDGRITLIRDQHAPLVLRFPLAPILEYSRDDRIDTLPELGVVEYFLAGCRGDALFYVPYASGNGPKIIWGTEVSMRWQEYLVVCSVSAHGYSGMHLVVGMDYENYYRPEEPYRTLAELTLSMLVYLKSNGAIFV